ncbi:Hypothetical predicted protein [Mytilus galloprovincialis]|nr:Hypothetical predicted protein [Mytilus galloprovincialis]
MTYLKTLEKKIDRLNEEVCGQKKAAASNFNIDTCTFKKKLNIFLKNSFSKRPWLQTQIDHEFKAEVQRHLKSEGYSSDPSAYKQIINEQKKEPILGRINIEEFAAVILTPYCSLGEKVDSQDRVRFCLILRSFMHKKNMLDSCEVLEVTADFWQYFKDFYEENMSSADCPRKWEVLAGIDKKRMINRRSKQDLNSTDSKRSIWYDCQIDLNSTDSKRSIWYDCQIDLNSTDSKRSIWYDCQIDLNSTDSKRSIWYDCQIDLNSTDSKKHLYDCQIDLNSQIPKEAFGMIAKRLDSTDSKRSIWVDCQ